MADERRTTSILLRKDWLECLNANAVAGSLASDCPKRAIDIREVVIGKTPSYCVKCTNKEIEAILELAMRHCRDAVADIRDGLYRFSGDAAN